jgi:predicted  nucleic acid-binding Zn-ribbon protein/ribosomal protein L40E
MHYCTNCGKLLVDTWKICAYCGVKIRKDLWKPGIEAEQEKKSLEKDLELPVDASQEVSASEGIKQEFTEEIKPIETTEIKSAIPIEESINQVQKPSLDEVKISQIKERSAILGTSRLVAKEQVESKSLKNLCTFCGFENPLEQIRCKQCGYKIKK